MTQRIPVEARCGEGGQNAYETTIDAVKELLFWEEMK